MKRIAPHPVWIGHAGDGRDFNRLYEIGIRAVLQLAIEEPAIQPPRDLIFVRIPLSDGGGNASSDLCLAIRTASHLFMMGVPTMVCCGAGMSRLPCIVAAALSLAFRLTPEEALERVEESGPCDVAPELWGETEALLAAWSSDSEI